MHAPISSLRGRMASGALAAAVALAFGLSAPAQAQYTYPGTTSSSGYPATSRRPSVKTQPVLYGGAAAAGRGALNYGTSQSAAGFRNTVTGKSSGPSTNVTGQQNSFTGPNGQKVNMSGSQSFTGPNGQKVGQQTPNGTYGGGYGHQKGSGINGGYSYTSQNGSMSGSRTGNAPGMANGDKPNFNNGGTAGASDSASELNQEHNPFSDGNGTTTSDKGTLTFKDHQKWSGTDSDGLTWNKGKPWDGPDGDGGFYTHGHHVKGSSGGDMPADTGGESGPGEVVSGTGKVVHPGRPGGSDVGGGQGQDSGASGGGSNRNNATGAYLAPSGQDVTRGPKPKEQGVLKTNYNGKLGVTDPQQNGGH